jgi:hypothetical protein
LLSHTTLLLAVALLATTIFGSLTAQAASPPTDRHKGHQWVARNLDGRLEAVMLASDGTLMHKWQTAPNGGWVADWALLGADTFSSDPSVGRNQDGRLEVFAVTDAGAVKHIWQTAPNSGWAASYDTLPTTFTFKNHPVAVAKNQDGRLEVFARKDTTASGEIVHIWQTAPNSGWAADWASLGADTFTYPPSVGINGDGRLEVFGVASGGAVSHTWQTAPNSGWGAWVGFGTTTLMSGPLAVANNKDGRLEVFARSSDSGHHIVHNWQTAPNSGWAAVTFWSDLGITDSYSKSIGDPAVGRNGDGRLEVFASAFTGSTPGGQVWHTYQTCAGCGWEELTTIGPSSTLGATAVGVNADARLEVFDHLACSHGKGHAWQVPAASAWSPWSGLGGASAEYEPACP